MKAIKKIGALVLTAAMLLALAATALAAEYTVEKGDSLWKIAKNQLGDGARWNEIYQENRSSIKDPEMIYEGQVLQIPGTPSALAAPVSPAPAAPATAPAETSAEISVSTADLQEQFEEEMHQARYITSRGAAYTLESLVPYQHYWFQKAWTHDKTGKGIEEAEKPEEIVATLRSLRESLVQVKDPEEVCWYIWKDGTPAHMPQEDGAANLEFAHTFDEAGFVPFLVPYMLEDQSQVKGNAVLVAGGGYNQRCHDYEGDASAAVLNELGYNCFILQRRVAPFEKIDSSIDLQRAVRYIKYYAKDYGIGAIENIFTIGFSGGGGTVANQLNTCYGGITPDAIYPTYVCDDIDKVDSDYKAAALIYSAVVEITGDYTSSNPNMPALFLTVGDLDNKAYDSSFKLLEAAQKNDWDAELFVAAGAPHGFALTGVRAFTDVGTTTSQQVPMILDNFLQVKFGLLPEHF